MPGPPAALPLSLTALPARSPSRSGVPVAAAAVDDRVLARVHRKDTVADVAVRVVAADRSRNQVERWPAKLALSKSR